MKVFMSDLNEARIENTVKVCSTLAEGYLNNFFWEDVLRRYYLHYKLTKNEKYKISIHDIVNFPVLALKKVSSTLPPTVDDAVLVDLYRTLLLKMREVNDNPKMSIEEYFSLAVHVPSHEDIKINLTECAKEASDKLVEDTVDKCLNVMYGSHGLECVVKDILKAK